MALRLLDLAQHDTDEQRDAREAGGKGDLEQDGEVLLEHGEKVRRP